MAVNEALIKGARDAAPKFRKVELFSEATKTAMNTAIASRKAEKMLRDQQVSAIVGELQEVDISVTPPEQINQQYEISGNIRNEVAALAAQKAKLPQNSPEAFAIQQMINQKKQMFSQVVNNAKDFKNLHEEYIKAEGWNMSAGVDPEKRKQLDAIFIDKNYTIEYDENGSPTYKTEFGEMSQKDLSNYFVKDDEMALGVTNYSEEVLTSGERGVKLEGARKDILYRKILNDINKGGPSRLKSLIYDDLVEGQSLGLSEDATAEDAAEAIVNNLINVNNQGLATYQNKQANIESKKSNDGLTSTQRFNKQRAQNYYSQYQKAGEALASFLATDSKNQDFIFNAAQNMGLNVNLLRTGDDEVVGYEFSNPTLGTKEQILLAGYTQEAGNLKIANVLGAADAGIQVQSENESQQFIYDSNTEETITMDEFKKRYPKLPSNIPSQEPDPFKN